MKNIYVITHTESVHHIEGKVGGWYDTPLTQKGRAQAQLVANKMLGLVNSNSPIITTSDLLRAQETADIIGNAFGCKCKLNSDLRELSYGVAGGRPQKWLNDRMIPAPHDNRLHHVKIEGGESIAEFIQRIYRAVDAVIADSNPNHIIVTHGYAVTFVVARWIKMPAASAGFVNFRSSAGGITHLQQDDYWQNRAVKQLNDISHLLAN